MTNRTNKGGYQNLLTYQNATIIYDFTVSFCKTYMTYKTNKSYRTNDQMVQAARSGKQNIVEGSAGKSIAANLKLTGVARASLSELLEDYRDFLRQRGLAEWEKDSPRARSVRGLAYKSNRTYTTYKTYMDEPEAAANAMISLINQTTFLLDRQVLALERKFVAEGGYAENLRAKRIDQQKRNLWRNLYD